MSVPGVPGDGARATRRRRAADGIPLDDATWEAILALGRELGVEP
jgi:LDH2 family malate/lactate/ureidoglycolate dehydrogenase